MARKKLKFYLWLRDLNIETGCAKLEVILINQWLERSKFITSYTNS